MSKVADYLMEESESIATVTGYDADFIFDRVIELTDDGETIEEALFEVGSIANEGDY